MRYQQRKHISIKQCKFAMIQHHVGTLPFLKPYSFLYQHGNYRQSLRWRVGTLSDALQRPLLYQQPVRWNRAKAPDRPLLKLTSLYPLKKYQPLLSRISFLPYFRAGVLFTELNRWTSNSRNNLKYQVIQATNLLTFVSWKFSRNPLDSLPCGYGQNLLVQVLV